MKSPFCKLFFLLMILVTGLPFSAFANAQENNGDIIARIGDQTVTLSQIDTIINSSSFVGMDIPPVGTPERDRARIVTLDKVISANLLYLDAKARKLDNNAEFQADVDRFANNVLAGLYRQKTLIGEIEVTASEIKDYCSKNFKANTELTDDLKLAVEAMIRKGKHKKRATDMRQRLRDGARVEVFQDALTPERDLTRGDEKVVAVLGQGNFTWGQVKDMLAGPGIVRASAGCGAFA